MNDPLRCIPDQTSGDQGTSITLSFLLFPSDIVLEDQIRVHFSQRATGALSNVSHLTVPTAPLAVLQDQAAW